VLKEDYYKKNALGLMQSINRSGGVVQAADIIEEVIKTGKPVLNQRHKSAK
jgi:UDP:flavonoid glycosyltransferase YjiC (YdhE family)